MILFPCKIRGCNLELLHQLRAVTEANAETVGSVEYNDLPCQGDGKQVVSPSSRR